MTRARRSQPLVLRYPLRTATAITVAVGLMGCGGGSSTPAPEMATSAITPSSGGTVTLPDNTARLDIPAGAVAATTMITVSTTSAAPPTGITADGPILKFEPDGLVFLKPVTVTFKLVNATHPVVYWSNTSGGYDAIASVVTGSSIAGQVMHFSSGFVGETPDASGSKTCTPGGSCAAGASCTYGASSSGGSTSTGSNAATNGGTTGGSTTGAPSGMSSAGPDAAVSMTGGSDGSKSGGTGTGSGSAMAADAGAPNPNAPAKTGALGSDTPSGPAGTAMCCSCGSDGMFECATCGSNSLNSGSIDGGAPTCVAGAPCSQVGSVCGASATGGGSGSTATNAGTGTGAPAADTGGAGSSSGGSTATPASSTPSSSSASCCTCNTDGTYHCGSCGGSTGGSTMTGGGGASDAGSTAPAGGGQCVPGGACLPGAGPCDDGSPTSCLMCECGADGTYVCSACPGFDAGTGPVTSDAGAGAVGQCVEGAPCPAGSAGGACENPSPTSCQMCKCGPQGTLVCNPCPDAPDAGGTSSPPADAGVGPDGTCKPGLQCAAADSCQNAQAGLCCQCAQGVLMCAPCGGASDGGAGGAPDGGGGAPAGGSCVQGADCPQPGMMCGGTGAAGCTKCTCTDGKTLSCVAC